ncbi:MAG: hotdog domain-containing protein [Eubacteriales bacterium]|nr:hotdog domain-containing protein [Eubacteriales bacterium]MDD3350312.1 hotdog domain-containing protein [Eubacteriales bacterium]
MIEHKIEKGLHFIFQKQGTVSGELPEEVSLGILEYLVSTPVILAIVIEAASSFLHPLVPEGYMTVGKEITLYHKEPTSIGDTITIKLTVTGVDGKRIYLDYTGYDSYGEICKGEYERVIVTPNELIERATQRHGGPEKTL